MEEISMNTLPGFKMQRSRHWRRGHLQIDIFGGGCYFPTSSPGIRGLNESDLRSCFMFPSPGDVRVYWRYERAALRICQGKGVDYFSEIKHGPSGTEGAVLVIGEALSKGTF